MGKEYFKKPYYFYIKEGDVNFSLYFSIQETLTEARRNDEKIDFIKGDLGLVKKTILEIVKSKKKYSKDDIKKKFESIKIGKKKNKKKEEIEEFIDLDGTLSTSKIPVLNQKQHTHKTTDQIIPAARITNNPVMRGFRSYYGESVEDIVKSVKSRLGKKIDMRDLIFKYLDTLANNITVYKTSNSYSLINQNSKIWYGEVTANRDCYINNNIIDDLVIVYNVDSVFIEKTIKEWIELIMGIKIRKTFLDIKGKTEIAEIINNAKIVKTLGQSDQITEDVDSNDKIKDLVFQYLNHITKGANLYRYKGSFFIIDVDKLYCFTKQQFDGMCWIWPPAVREIVTFFNLSERDATYFTQKWIENITKRKGVIDYYGRLGIPGDVYVKTIIKSGKLVKTLGQSNSINEQTRLDHLINKLTKPVEDNQPLLSVDELIKIVTADPKTIISGNIPDDAKETDLSKIKKVGPYSQWLIKQFVLGKKYDGGDDFVESFFENLHKVSEDLTKFDRFKERIPKGKRDINKLTIYELAIIVKNISLSGKSYLNVEDLSPLVFKYLNTITNGANIYKSNINNEEIISIINPNTNHLFTLIITNPRDEKQLGECWLHTDIYKEIHTLFNIDMNDAKTITKRWVENVTKETINKLVDIGDQSGLAKYLIQNGKIVKTLGQSNSINEVDYSEAFGYEETKDMDAEETKQYLINKMGLEPEDAEERTKQFGKTPNKKKKAPKHIQNKKGFIDRLTLAEREKAEAKKVVEDILTKKYIDTYDVNPKEKKEVSKILLKNIKSLKKMASRDGLSIRDIIKLFKDEQ